MRKLPDHRRGPVIPPVDTDTFVTPPYARMPIGDLPYARRWASRVLAWRRMPETRRRPSHYGPPSQRKRAGRQLTLPSLRELGIPTRLSPIHPLRLDLASPKAWKRLHPTARRLLLASEMELALQLPDGHEARDWVRPPKLQPGRVPAKQAARGTSTPRTKHQENDSAETKREN